jgi:hypothetical protein
MLSQGYRSTCICCASEMPSDPAREPYDFADGMGGITSVQQKYISCMRGAVPAPLVLRRLYKHYITIKAFPKYTHRNSPSHPF